MFYWWKRRRRMRRWCLRHYRLACIVDGRDLLKIKITPERRFHHHCSTRSRASDELIDISRNGSCSTRASEIMDTGVSYRGETKYLGWHVSGAIDISSARSGLHSSDDNPVLSNSMAGMAINPTRSCAYLYPLKGRHYKNPHIVCPEICTTIP